MWKAELLYLSKLLKNVKHLGIIVMLCNKKSILQSFNIFKVCNEKGRYFFSLLYTLGLYIASLQLLKY